MALKLIFMMMLCISIAHPAMTGPPPPAQEPGVTAVELGERFRERLAAMPQLVVESRQKVFYINTPVTSATDRALIERDASRALGLATSGQYADVELVSVTARVRSTMFPDRFEATFWRDDVDVPITELKLSPSEMPGAPPELLEAHYYPKLDVRRRTQYALDDDYPFGADEPALPNPLFSEIPGACNTAEFWFTWLGESTQAQLMGSIIAQGTVAGIERFNGELAYRVARPLYMREEGDMVRSGHHTYWLSVEDNLLIGWRHEHVDIDVNIDAAYKIVQSDYSYELPHDLDRPISNNRKEKQ